jgi:hypothetical protein
MIIHGTEMGFPGQIIPGGSCKGLVFPFLALHENPLKQEPNVGEWLQKLSVGLDAALLDLITVAL